MHALTPPHPLRVRVRARALSLSPKLAVLAEMLQPDQAAGKAVDKGPQVSNWSDPAKLTPQQIKYAAMDAVVSVEVHATLQKVLERALRENIGVGEDVIVLDRTKNSRVAVGKTLKVTPASSSFPSCSTSFHSSSSSASSPAC